MENIEMKIGLFLDCGDFYGGAERRFSRAYAHLLGTHDISMVTTSSSLECLKKSGLLSGDENVIVFNDNSRLKKFRIFKFWYAIKFVLFMVFKDVDHIHFCVNPSQYSFFYSLLFTRRRFSLSFVNSARKVWQDYSFDKKVMWKVSLSRAKYIDALSSDIKGHLVSVFNTDPHKISVSPCSFTDTSKAVFCSSIDKKDIDFCILSRFVPQKGYDLLFAALGRLCLKNRRKLRIGLYGGGPLEEYITTNADALSGNYEFNVGLIEDSFEILSRVKFFLSLQDNENYPSQSLLESMVSGAVPIATDVGETRRLVTEENGFLVNADPHSLAETMQKALSITNEEYTLKSTKARAEVVGNHTVDKFSSYLWDLVSH